MTFDDLSTFDLNLIKNQAVDLMVTKGNLNRYWALFDVVVSCIKSKGFSISDEPKNMQNEFCKKYEFGKSLRSENDERSADDVIKLVFEFLSSLNIVISKDPSKTKTWSTPGPAWYTPDKGWRKPWILFLPK